MKRLLCHLVLCTSLLSSAQSDSLSQGIRWTETISWEQIKQKAKQDGKYIFVDCYATWCEPCKKMDKQVYSDYGVGRLVNDRFVSVKIQMDKTIAGADLTGWSGDAKRIERNYSITSFPTFLFFAPDGTPVHKSAGFKNAQEFALLIKDVFIPEKQYYSLLTNYEPGVIELTELKGLAREIKNFDKGLAQKMALDCLQRLPKSEIDKDDNLKFISEFSESLAIQDFGLLYLQQLPQSDYSGDKNYNLIVSLRKRPEVEHLVLGYLNNIGLARLKEKANLRLLTLFRNNQEAIRLADVYLASLKSKEVYTRDNIEMMASFTRTSTDKNFKVFLNNSRQVDHAMKRKGYSENVINDIIEKEELTEYYEMARRNGSADSIDWSHVRQAISKKYSKSIADKIVLGGKVYVYEYFAKTLGKNWREYINLNIQYLDKYGTDTTNGYVDAVILNNFAWDAIFFHSENKEELLKAAEWMKGVMRRHPEDISYIDTYANLKYKSGDIKEAIRMEEKALNMAINQKDDFLIKEFSATLEKMKNNMPTWSQER